MGKKFYITTTLPYVNAEPHIGFAMEIVHADIIARYRKILGDDIFFNTGTDEHGLKIYRKALEEGKEPQTYVDEYAEKFKNLKKTLNLSDDLHFIRTTDSHHKKAAQEFWRICEKNGDIYKDTYKTKYCVGCELEKTDSELVDSKCLIHPNLELEIIEEENYFFNFKKYQKPLLEFYGKNPEFILPESRFNEIKNFVAAGLKEFSISRLKEKMPWGIPVPGDEKHVMYVWFDALINYISTLGWPENNKNFEDFWGTKEKPNAIQFAGKDQIRQQAAMWQAMLMSANLPNSKQILIHGFITSDGQKMSKSLGNVVNPYEIVEKYGTDALRYWLTREISAFDDGDFTSEKFKERYNADLANGLGNFAARVISLGEGQGKIPLNDFKLSNLISAKIEFTKLEIAKKTEAYRFNEAIMTIWELVQFGDKFIGDKEPWKKRGKEDTQVVYEVAIILDNVAAMLKPFLPKTAKEIAESIDSSNPDREFGPVMRFKKQPPLFPRK